MLNGAHFRANDVSGDPARAGARPPFDAFEAAEDFITAIEELRARDQWVGWKLVMRAGARKPTKPPVNPHNGFAASHSNPSTWGSFKQAQSAVKRYGLAGVGYVLSDDDDYTGIDLDKCRNADTGEIEDWAKEVIAFAETYAEISPSGTGVRMFVRGKIDKAVKSDVARVEIYGAQRYLTITNNHIEGTPLDIREAPKTLAALIARAAAMSPKREERPESQPQNHANSGKTRQNGESGARAWAAAALDGKAEELATLGEGGRNHALNASAYSMGTMIARGWIDEATVRAALEDACRANGLWKDDGPFGVRATLSSGVKSGMSNPHADLPEREDSPEDQDAIRRGDEIAAKRINDRGDGEGAKIDPETGEVLGEEPSADGAGHSGAKDSASGGAQAKSAPTIKATPYSWPDCQSIPPREWLYGHHLIRGFVSATVAPGGVGKSSLLIAEGAAMVSGRALLHGVEPIGPLNVWLWNGEDPTMELNRRVAATMKHFKIKQQDCQGRLYVDSGREMKIVIAKMQMGGATICRPIVKAIKETIEEHKIDVVVIDPFVSSHRVSENDNNAIDEIAREWADIADKTGCAIELVHHVRKVGDAEVTVEMARGASALISAARCARVLNPMSADEGKKAGVEIRRTYFRVNDGKSNMSPASEKATWFHMQSVNLENNGRYLEGDSIGVVTDWKWPDPLDDVTSKDLQTVLQVVGAGRWRESPQAKDWVGRAVAEALGLDVEDEQAKAKIKGLLKIWLKTGALVVVEAKDDKGMDRKFVEVGSAPDG